MNKPVAPMTHFEDAGGVNNTIKVPLPIESMSGAQYQCDL